MHRSLVFFLAIFGLLLFSGAFAGTVKAPAPAAKLISVEGLVSVRPENAARWTPAADRQVILAGDELRTSVHGPNAAALALAGGGEVILGPGSLLRVEAGGRILLVQGELAVVAAGAGTPKEGVWRAGDEGLAKLKKDPAWLDGFVNLNPRESMGALLANVDGRDVPLTLGYHKVTVDIRDQIARTVIEESFVNHTDGTLEGVFQFPLPQDASISNFGMWIGDRLVEADVVEKQRAREIYETIKREKRDPGLLEWAGGSLFKARVYPIPAHSEKRVTITYTQVLPLRRGAWTWDYALRSDLLRAHPLRELEIDVRIHEERGLAEVTCPTHAARVEKSAQGARIRFNAEDYRPDQDFQVVVAPKMSPSGISLVTHRRGDDGYFMVLFQPPEDTTTGARLVLPDGAPLSLVLLADTSGSMDPDTRRAQEAFLRALLGSLRPEDRFRLAVCGAACAWADPGMVPALDANRIRALAFLAARESLGWTDLDALADAALAAADGDTHVIYIGDGRHSAGDADTAALAARLAARGSVKAASIHAVAPGNLVEPPVMAALAALGGGSFRRIRDGDGPRTIARELLGDILVPGMRDLEVAFEGFRTARVYPAVLPNLAAGTQHIVVGRYRPGDDVSKGRVVIRGRDADRVRTWTEDVSFVGADQGNSFIPRLWARRYLDELLRGGADADRRDRIVSFSQEFRIMTPFTSFLVLESDGDRERFGVKRHFQMRNGEDFFAEGRSRTDFALARKAMKKAGTWRTMLRRVVLSSMRGMGRDLSMLSATVLRYPTSSMSNGFGRETGGWDGLDMTAAGFGKELFWKSGGKRGEILGDLTLSLDEDGPADDFSDSGMREVSKSEVAFPMASAAVGIPMEQSLERLDMPVDTKSVTWGDELSMDGRFLPMGGEALYDGEMGISDGIQAGRSRLLGAGLSGLDFGGNYRSSLQTQGRRTSRFSGLLQSSSLEAMPTAGAGNVLDQAWWLQRLTGYIHDAPADLPLPPALPVDAKLAELSKRLYRGDGLSPDAGIEIRRVIRTFAPARGVIRSESDETAVLAGTRWIHRVRNSGVDSRLTWCDGEEYVAATLPFALGWRRPAKAVEGTASPVSIGGFLLSKIADSYREYELNFDFEGDGQSRQCVTARWSPPEPGLGNVETVVRVVVDTDRDVILEIEYEYGGKRSNRTVFSDFVKVRGAWWPGRSEVLDAEGRKNTETELTYRALDAEGIAKAAADAVAALDDTILFDRPIPAMDEARERAAAGRGDRGDHLALLLADVALQRWDLAFRHLDGLDRLHPDAPGLGWLRLALEIQSRRHQSMKDRMVAVAVRLAGDKGTEAFSQARYLVEQGPQGLQAHEVLEVMDRVAPVYARQPEWSTAHTTFGTNRTSWLRSAGRTDEADIAEAALLVRFPGEYSVVQSHAWSLRNRGDSDGACAALQEALSKHGPWEPWEESTLRSQWSQILGDQGRVVEALELVESWMDRGLDQAQLYSQYLSLLVRTGREDKASDVIRRWIADSVGAPGDDAAATARLQAAVNQMLGQGYNLYTYTVEKKWVPVLTDLAIRLGSDPARYYIVSQILTQEGMRQHRADRVIRKAWRGILDKQMASLGASTVRFLAGQLLGGEPTVPPEVWRTLARAAGKRMDAAKTPRSKHTWSDIVLQLLASHVDLADEAVAFLRERYEWTTDEYRAVNRDALFYALLTRPWTSELEAELLILALTQANDAERKGGAWTRVHALQTAADWMVRGRVRKAAEAWKDKEDLTRTVRRSLLLDATKAAYGEVAVVLAGIDGPTPLQDWITLEVAYHEILGGLAAGPIAARCGKMLDRETIRRPGEDRAAKVLRERLVTTLEYLATRHDAAPALAEVLLARIDRELEAAPKDRYWRTHKVRVLMALDRADALETELKSWLKAGGSGPAWRRALGYLMAETGRIPEAIEHFEALRGSGQLMGHEWSTLADWYLVEGRRSDRDGANLERFLALPEQQLSTYYYQITSRAGVTGAIEVDEEILSLLTAMLRKSQYPANYVWQVQNLFQQTRDSRLLGVLADGILGHSPGGVYPILENIRYILSEVQDEASVDSGVAAIEAVRKRAKSVLDRRALDLLLVAVERRATELVNEPGPHGKNALRALARAGKDTWQEGERRLMADFLVNLGHIAWDQLAQAQRQGMEALLDGEQRGTEDHLAIAASLAVLRWDYGMKKQAIKGLRGALDAYLDSRKGILPSPQNHVVETLVGHMEMERMHSDAEVLLGQLEERAINAGQRWWARHRALSVHAHALQSGGVTSLGKGTILYAALHHRLLKELTEQPPRHHSLLVSTLTQFFYTARDRRLGNAAGDLLSFVRDHLPAVLETRTNDYQSIIGVVADCLRGLINAREGLAFLVGRMETEPAWLIHTNQSGWNWHGYRLAQWRREARKLGALEDRLFKLVAKQLRRELETRRRLNGGMYHQSYGDFWSGKADAFARITHEILRANPDDGPLIEYAAQYLWDGLSRRDDAIRVLSVAWRKDLLSEAGGSLLASYLFTEARYADAVPVLRKLLELRPRDHNLLSQLIESLCRPGKKKAWTRLLADTEADFTKEGIWGWNAQTTFAGACQRCGAWDDAVRLFETGIDGYMDAGRQQPRGDASLSAWYSGLAEAYAGLGDTAKAVDAASGAVVAWGRNQTQRSAALGTLTKVLMSAKDLDGYIKEFERQVEETGLENPTVRKALGKVLMVQKEDAAALRQFEHALEISRWDTEVLDSVVEIHRRGKRYRKAAEARLRACRAVPVEFACWDKAAALYAEAGDAAAAERARTSIVEAAPDEADAHEALARLFQDEGRWLDALGRWRQVVRLREQAPAGYLGMAAAAVKAQVWDEADRAVDHILSRVWPQVFQHIVRQALDLKRVIDSH